MRTALAAEIGLHRDTVAAKVADDLLVRHPDWSERYGHQAATPGWQGVRHHVDFVQAAVEVNDPAIFRAYAVGCRDLLGPRGISVELLVEDLEATRDELVLRLSSPAAEAVIRVMRVGLAALAAGEVVPQAADDPLSPAGRRYFTASVNGRRKEALEVVRAALRSGESSVDIYVEIFQRALYEVGHQWETTGLTIAEEHMATATTQFILSVIHEEQLRTATHRGTAVVTGVVNEQHVVGASIIANVLDAEGWDVRFLGTDIPHDDIVAAIEDSKASLVAISVTMDDCVADARDLIARIRRSSTKPPRIIVGGAALSRDADLWHAIGADGFAVDARRVAELALR